MRTKITKTKELNKDMIEIIKHHLKDAAARDTIACYEMWSHETVYEKNKEGEIDWMISYFFLGFDWDMIIVMQRNNKFPKDLWRILRDTINNRVKPLRIASDPDNDAIVKRSMERYGGVWHDDEIWFN